MEDEGPDGPARFAELGDETPSHFVCSFLQERPFTEDGPIFKDRPDLSPEIREIRWCARLVREYRGGPQHHAPQNKLVRTVYNHVLVYLCTRVVLDAINWEDLSKDRSYLKGEVRKFIYFFKVTIYETPEILNYTTDDFLFRGREPLWMWILPKILRLLGDDRCGAISGELEEFCKFVVMMARETTSLRKQAELMIQYFQDIVDEILSRIRTLPTEDEPKEVEFDLPPMPVVASTADKAAHWTTSRSFVQTIADQVQHWKDPKFCPTTSPLPASDSPHLAEGCIYTLHDLGTAVRQASSLLSIINAEALEMGASDTLYCARPDLATWLLDSCLEIHHMHYNSKEQLLHVKSPSILPMVLDLAQSYSLREAVDSAVRIKSNHVLVLVCASIASALTAWLRQGVSNEEASKPSLEVFCRALTLIAEEGVKIRSVPKLVASCLLPPLDELVATDENCGPDSQVSKLRNQLRSAVASVRLDAESAPLYLVTAIDDELRRLDHYRAYRFLNSPGADGGQDRGIQRPAKRRKTGHQVPTALSRITDSITKHPSLLLEDPEALRASIVQNFLSMSHSERCREVFLLGRAACASDDTLDITRGHATPGDTYHCSICDGPSSTSYDAARPLPHAAAKETLSRIFADIIQLECFRSSSDLRVAGMRALRHVVIHTSDPGLFRIEASALGKWCLQSLNSTEQELRVEAARALPAFLKTWKRRELSLSVRGQDLIRVNRHAAMVVLRSLRDNDPDLEKTSLVAWGLLGEVSHGEPLAVVLIKLLRDLGHENASVATCAAETTRKLARHRGLTPEQLFSPYWKTLAFTVVEDMVSRPLRATRVASMFGISVEELLKRLQAHAIPWLVLAKKRDVIARIAQARGDKEYWMPCLDPDNLSRILVLLLLQDKLQDAPDFEAAAMDLFRRISSHFSRVTLAELLSPEVFAVTLELLKQAGESNGPDKARITRALSTIADILAPEEEDKRSNKGLFLPRFFEQHALGLATRLSEAINSPRRPAGEGRRCIRAMQEMVTMDRIGTQAAAPQITLCLESALKFRGLRAAAMSCWWHVVAWMEDMDLHRLLETTFSIICRYWGSLDDRSRRNCKLMIGRLLDQHRPVIQAAADKLPLLPDVADLRDAAEEIASLRKPLDTRSSYAVFVQRLRHENSGVVEKALAELATFLRRNQGYLHASAVSERPDSVVLDLSRALLDCVAKYNGSQQDIAQGIARKCTECLGLVGCLDSNRLETTREVRQFVVVHNFEDPNETTDFVLFMLDTVLVDSFRSTTDTQLQGFLSYVMQELLERCGLKKACAAGTDTDLFKKWKALSEYKRRVLTPFLTSKYSVAPMAKQEVPYPIFRPGKSYSSWMRAYVLDLLQKGQNAFGRIVFEPLCRLIRVKDLTVAEFLLPFLAAHVFLASESSDDRDHLVQEFRAILRYELPDTATYAEREDLKRCYEAVFRVLDYFHLWIQRRTSRERPQSQAEKAKVDGQVDRVKKAIADIPAHLLSKRAEDCKQYARALYYLEPRIWDATQKKAKESAKEKAREGTLLKRKESTAAQEDHKQPMESEQHKSASRNLQLVEGIYANIDEPDGLGGITTRFPRPGQLWQQLLQGQKKTGNWDSALTYLETCLASEPDNVDYQLDKLKCLTQSGQYATLLSYAEGLKSSSSPTNKIAPFVAEASWCTGNWVKLEKCLESYNGADVTDVFNLGVGAAILCLRKGDTLGFSNFIRKMRDKVASSMSHSATSSLAAAHDALLNCHVLSELELIAELPARVRPRDEYSEFLEMLDRRLDVVGAYVNDKQYLLGMRIAAMEVTRPKFLNQDVSRLWLSSARLARKSDSMQRAFNAVVQATKLEDPSAAMENARVLWMKGDRRSAIQLLRGDISSNPYPRVVEPLNESFTTIALQQRRRLDARRNRLEAKRQLLFAKWQDSDGQCQAAVVRAEYEQVVAKDPEWDSGYYHLGHYYNKVLESEKALDLDNQSTEYASGEMATNVIENYLQSLIHGTKYLHFALPKALTLWMELGSSADRAKHLAFKRNEAHTALFESRVKVLTALHANILRCLDKIQPWVFYTALPQFVARIAHPNKDVFEVLKEIIIKVVEAYPRQALWFLFPLMTMTKTDSLRWQRGQAILEKLRNNNKKLEGPGLTMRQLLKMAEKLAEQLLRASNNGDFNGNTNRTVVASLTRDMGFKHRYTPCPLVVPVESCLTPILPAKGDDLGKHRPFPKDVITIDSFEDEVLVLGSLARPRRLTVVGSDLKKYGLLAKPKDDLRTDQRLMEFNNIINQSLKRDPECSRRGLYIRTYAVTPINEECGLIEWVDGLKPLRDILLSAYKERGVNPNYSEISRLMEEASKSEKQINIFTDQVLGQFPPVLMSWFRNQFPHPEDWFAARLRYTRSCAVMSMVGTVLGLGDRHGENVLLEEGTGGVFHVDFNCLFDKGLTFAKPERVPFRLTHNMVEAMGPHGFEGPFRKCSELTLSVMRQQQETLTAILECFVHDPTLDLQRDKKRAARNGDGKEGVKDAARAGKAKEDRKAVKLDPQSVVASIKRKLTGLMGNESIPLGVQGQADELIKQATDPRNLTAMYIGWCPFL